MDHETCNEMLHSKVSNLVPREVEHSKLRTLLGDHPQCRTTCDSVRLGPLGEPRADHVRRSEELGLTVIVVK